MLFHMILKRYLGKFRRENSVDDSGQSGDRYRDGWQHGIQRRQNNFNYLIAEEDFDKESEKDSFTFFLDDYSIDNTSFLLMICNKLKLFNPNLFHSWW